MKKLIYFIALLTFILNLDEYCQAQDVDSESWNKTFSLHFGYPIGNVSWEYSHPMYGSGTVQTISETGTFDSKSIFTGGFGISKNYIGINTNLGIFQAQIDVDKTGESYKFNSIFGALNGSFYPMKNPVDKFVPFVRTGIGGIKCTGDLDNSALIFLFGGGIRSYFTKKLGASAQLTGRYLKYDEIPLDIAITGDISFTSFATEFGILYSF